MNFETYALNSNCRVQDHCKQIVNFGCEGYADELDGFVHLLAEKMPDDVDDILQSWNTLLDQWTTFQDFSRTIADLNKYRHFADGSKWILKYMATPDWLQKFAWKSMRFEAYKSVDGWWRYIDVFDETTGIHYEFKSTLASSTPNSSFAQQFTRDLWSAWDLDKIKWYYDGSKISELNKTQFVNKLENSSEFMNNFDSGTHPIKNVFEQYFIWDEFSTPQDLIFKLREDHDRFNLIFEIK